MHATAITAHCLDDAVDIVDPSAVVADRVSTSVGTGPPNVVIRDAADRIGVEITGREEAVDRVAALLAAISSDSMWWHDPLPRGGIYVGEVIDTKRSGAIVETPDGNGFLPYGKVDGRIDEGDRPVVQVIDPEPPWITGRRPVLGTGISCPGTYVSLVHDADADIVDAPSESLARTVERLGPDVPAGWGISIHGRADAIDVTVINDEIGRLAEQVSSLAESVRSATDDSIERIAMPLSSAWCRIGRNGRFALDDIRNQVVHTIDGHHRLKSIGNAASTAVDLIERYGIEEVSYDPDAVFDTFGPTLGDDVRIDHGKPTGETIQLGRGEVIGREEDGSITVRRVLSGTGQYDALDSPKEEGDRADTTFVEGQWWYPTVYRGNDGAYKGTYVNIGTPLEIMPDTVRYTDLYIDVVKSKSGDVAIVDRDELAAATDVGDVTSDLADRAESVAAAVERAF